MKTRLAFRNTRPMGKRDALYFPLLLMRHPGGAGVSLVLEGVWNTLKATEAAWLTLLRDDVMRRRRYRCSGLQ